MDPLMIELIDRWSRSVLDFKVVMRLFTWGVNGRGKASKRGSGIGEAALSEEGLGNQQWAGEVDDRRR